MEEQELVSKKQILTDLGGMVLKLPNIYTHGWQFPLEKRVFMAALALVTRDAYQEIKDSLDHLCLLDTFDEEEYNHLQLFAQGYMSKDNPLVAKLEEKEQKAKSDAKGTDDASLGFRLYDHDLRNLVSMSVHYFNRFYEHYEKGKSLRRLRQSSQFANDFYISMANYQLFCCTMAYLATHDEKFNISVPVVQSGYLLDEALSAKIPLDNNIEGNIHASEYVAFYQLAKNAPNRERAIKFKKEGEYAALTVIDHGRGIRDIDGTPLPRERIPEIFGDFTTIVDGSEKLGGLGLQVAKRLAEMSDGYITMKTKTAKNPVICYDTRETEANLSSERMHMGSEFTLYIPLSRTV